MVRMTGSYVPVAPLGAVGPGKCMGLSQGIAGQAFVAYPQRKFCSPPGGLGFFEGVGVGSTVLTFGLLALGAFVIYKVVKK